ncbi:glycosyltransferase [Candidatus Planktophila dulcis]|uniref:glycosyltransferase n=1 Tax=Candidatus Planktophila dulcis TaxID=1884914 RepID=UPI00167FE0EC|nr:glycosyltransferase [Candidatus Planktophila dulcis]
MDDSSPIFAHQAQAVESLAFYFEEITVVTGKIGTYRPSSNIRVISTEWMPGHRCRNIGQFYIKVIPLLMKKNTQIFSHMTEVQSALIAPLTRLFRIRHYLWYAHLSNSIFLKWCHLLTSGIITSTSGSCPISDFKVHPVGQGVDSSKFLPIHLDADLKKVRFLHFGRFDPSKNIREILKTCEVLRESGQEIIFTQIGAPSTDIYEKQAFLIREEFRELDWVSFLPSILRADISSEMEKHSAFIHAYRGSLDKTLIEATFLTIPVITVNPEYIRIFGSWSGKQNPSLLQECQSFLNQDKVEIAKIAKSRREIAEQNHSLENWTRAIANFFN